MGGCVLELSAFDATPPLLTSTSRSYPSSAYYSEPTKVRSIVSYTVRLSRYRYDTAMPKHKTIYRPSPLMIATESSVAPQGYSNSILSCLSQRSRSDHRAAEPARRSKKSSRSASKERAVRSQQASESTEEAAGVSARIEPGSISYGVN